jgi:thymidylate synthase
MNNIDKQYQQLLQDILDYGIEKKDRTGTGTKSIFGYTIRHNMQEGFPLLTTKKMAWKTMVTELMWFLRGDTNIQYLVQNDCHIWDGDAYKNYVEKIKRSIDVNAEQGADIEELKQYLVLSKEDFIDEIKNDPEFAQTWGELGPIYGNQWRSWVYDKDMDYGTESSVDQISNLVDQLKTNPDSRRLMVSAWNVGELDQMVLPPCHYGFQVYTRELSKEEKLQYIRSRFTPVTTGEEQINISKNMPTRAISLMWNQRSVDTFLGLPFNIASYALLLEILAKAVQMIPDQLIGSLGDVHLYNNHIDQAKEQLTRDSFELPRLKMNPIFLANLEHKGLDEAINGQVNFELEGYQSHASIKAPLSN